MMGCGFSMEIEGLEGMLKETEQSEGAGVMIWGLEAKDEDAAVPWEKVVPTPPVEACCNARSEKSWGSEGLMESWSYPLSVGLPSMVLLVF